MNQKETLLISVTIFLTIVAWVTFELYGIRRGTPTEADIQAISVDYTINISVLETLKNKIP